MEPVNNNHKDSRPRGILVPLVTPLLTNDYVARPLEQYPLDNRNQIIESLDQFKKDNF